MTADVFSKLSDFLHAQSARIEMKKVNESFFLMILDNVASGSRIYAENAFIQHGAVSCLLHSIAVAYYSYKIAKLFSRWFADDKSLIRGALLHDYFLYDWHIPDKKHRLHGFRHPKTALLNAREDFELTPMEEDIVKNHMFPLTVLPPKYKETLLVCMVDKACSVYEFFAEMPYKKRAVHGMYKRVLAVNGK